jgi:hypothetical protein
MAEQEEPVRRRAALKVIKLGMDTKEVIARFEAERQALAMMDHPNIAKVFDAGATATGRPFFVMELVRGIPLTKYCDESNLPTEERLRLFTAVCHAIQHAHQKSVIHRDIKPSWRHDLGKGRLTDAEIQRRLEQIKLATESSLRASQMDIEGDKGVPSDVVLRKARAALR